MRTQAIKSLLHQFVSVEEEAWIDFEYFFSVINLKKHEKLWCAGDVCKHLVFINHGLVHCYNELSEKEITTHIYFENSLFCDDYSFISQQPGLNTYVALEETELITVPRAALYLMYDKYKSFERLGRMLVESIHIKYIEASQKMRYATAEDNYRQLLIHSPHFIQRVPQKIIASYLNITPEHLSRIRKTVAHTASS